MDNYGYTSFVLLVTGARLVEVKNLVSRYGSIMDISAKEYGASGYWYIEIDVFDDGRSRKELADFVFRTFPFIAIRQKGSSFIIANNKDDFKTALTTLYTQETKDEFLYNMLSIDERYDALEEASNYTFNYLDDIRIEKWIGGCMYSLIYDRNSPTIFTENPEVDLVFETSGGSEIVDMTEGLGIFKFHVAILK